MVKNEATRFLGNLARAATIGALPLVALVAGHRPAQACNVGVPGCGTPKPPSYSYNTIIFNSGSAASNDQLWAASNLVTGGVYSSTLFTSAQNTHATYVATWPTGAVVASAIVLRARMSGTRALGFPVAYRILVTNPANTAWTVLGSYTAQPDGAGVVSIPITTPVVTHGVMVQPTTIGVDNVGNHVFQLQGLEIAQSTHAAKLYTGSVQASELAAGAATAASRGFAAGSAHAGITGSVSYQSAAQSPNPYQPSFSGTGSSTYFGSDGDQAGSPVYVGTTGNAIADSAGQVAGQAVANSNTSAGTPLGTDPGLQGSVAEAVANAVRESQEAGGDLNDQLDAAEAAAEAAIYDAATAAGGTGADGSADSEAVFNATLQALEAHFSAE